MTSPRSFFIFLCFFSELVGLAAINGFTAVCLFLCMFYVIIFLGTCFMGVLTGLIFLPSFFFGGNPPAGGDTFHRKLNGFDSHPLLFFPSFFFAGGDMFHRDFNGVDPHPLLPCPLSQSATST